MIVTVISLARELWRLLTPVLHQVLLILGLLPHSCQVLLVTACCILLCFSQVVSHRDGQLKLVGRDSCCVFDLLGCALHGLLAAFGCLLLVG